jgi:hypothetical protein
VASLIVFLGIKVILALQNECGNDLYSLPFVRVGR